MGFWKGKQVAPGVYRPSFVHWFLKPRISGNYINGLGERKPRRPRPVYHRMDLRHPWWWVQMSFYLRNALVSVYREFMAEHFAISRAELPPVADRKEDDKPEVWSRRVKEFALSCDGCDVVGIMRVNHDWITDETTIAEPWIIMIGGTMNYHEIAKAPSIRTNADVLRTYVFTEHAAIDVAKWIRARGWTATPGGGPTGSPINLIPHAIAAGLGELGKYGSMMHDRLGSCFRLSYVLTDLPLVPDGPREFGVDSFCMNCRLCTAACPPGAIFDTKQWVRGDYKWYVDFDKCVPYFNEHYACGLCLAVCPWSRPGVAENLARKMQRRQVFHLAETRI